jgi:hypothetical protein
VGCGELAALVCFTGEEGSENGRRVPSAVAEGPLGTLGAGLLDTGGAGDLPATLKAISTSLTHLINAITFAKQSSATKNEN